MDLITPEIPQTELVLLPAADDLAKALHRLLAGRQDTLAVAESLTAGLLQSTIAMASGSSWYFLGGMTVYNAEQKIRHLHVNAGLCDLTNCVDPMVAEQMVVGIQAMYGSTIGIATTGYAEPNPMWHIEQPMAYYCIYLDGRFYKGRVDGPSLGRNGMREYVTRYVLNELVGLLAQRGTK